MYLRSARSLILAAIFLCGVLISAESRSGSMGTDASPAKELRSDTTDSSYVHKIAFDSERSGNDEIYTINIDGTGLKRLTFQSAPDQCPAFSPDGTKIAFASKRDGNHQLYVMDANGNNQQRIIATITNDIHPAWSHDGTKLVYTVFTSDAYDDGEIFMINADGSEPHQLTDTPASNQLPDWSPDDSRILFNSTRDGNRELYVMDT